MDSNIRYWEKILQAPTAAYQELFDAERSYLLAHIYIDDKVLDVGSGDGRNLKTIFQKTKFATGIDNDKIIVERTAKDFTDSPTIKVVHGDASSLPFDDGSFDTVTFMMILPNLDERKQGALSEAARVLKKDGSIILSTFSETALQERMKAYERIGIPINGIEGTKVIFDKSVGANISEQFSMSELESLATKSGMRIIDSKKVGDLAYICSLTF